ncbi:MAG: Hpt domain-containing protein, partial [Candidatus Taylorbacteria bacterium]|nr:Hpt domain-containing protein [Candidatus Taylorbacteria bacterium]
TDNTEKYKSLFLTEAEEKIAALNTALLGLEKEPGSSAFANDAMRAAHTLKSSAAAMDFTEISHLAHAMENFFEQVRSGKQPLAPQNVEMLFESVDALSASLTALKKGESELATRALIEKLQSKETENGKNPQPNSYKLKASLAPIETIRVNVKTLGTLVNLTEELLVTQMRFKEMLRRTEEPDTRLAEASAKLVGESKVIAESFGRLTSDLQYNVTQAHMVPLGQLFEQTPRIVRDLAKEQGKEVEFSITGQEIALDRAVVDRLGEPLIHLLRNAVDHGVEKSGKITLSAERLRDSVTVTVRNGGVIDFPRLIEVAAQKGIIDQQTRDKYAQDINKWQTEIKNLMYRLSTKKTVTETSGRGVGMSIVKSAIESLGGRVTIESKDGGTSFILTLPLTMAIIQALLSRVANQVFALPFSQVDRLVRVPFADIKRAFDQEMAVVDGQEIPMVRLDERFSIEREKSGIFLSEEEAKETKYQIKAELMIITKQEGASPMGIVVDEVLSEQQIVVKPLKGVLKQTKGFAGVTLL